MQSENKFRICITHYELFRIFVTDIASPLVDRAGQDIDGSVPDYRTPEPSRLSVPSGTKDVF